MEEQKKTKGTQPVAQPIATEMSRKRHRNEAKDVKADKIAAADKMSQEYFLKQTSAAGKIEQMEADNKKLREGHASLTLLKGKLACIYSFTQCMYLQYNIMFCTSHANYSINKLISTSVVTKML